MGVNSVTVGGQRPVEQRQPELRQLQSYWRPLLCEYVEFGDGDRLRQNGEKATSQNGGKRVQVGLVMIT